MLIQRLLILHWTALTERSTALKISKEGTLFYIFIPRTIRQDAPSKRRGLQKKRSELEKLGAAVVGVSSDGYDSHCKFTDKYGLKILLLSDPSNETIKKYDAYGNKGIFGMGTMRKTFIIDKSGTIVKVYPKVNPVGHEDEIINFLKGA